MRAWHHVPRDRDALRILSERSTLNGLRRVAFQLSPAISAALLTVRTAAWNLWLGTVPLCFPYLVANL